NDLGGLTRGHATAVGDLELEDVAAGSVELNLRGHATAIGHETQLEAFRGLVNGPVVVGDGVAVGGRRVGAVERGGLQRDAIAERVPIGDGGADPRDCDRTGVLIVAVGRVDVVNCVGRIGLCVDIADSIGGCVSGVDSIAGVAGVHGDSRPT